MNRRAQWMVLLGLGVVCSILLIRLFAEPDRAHVPLTYVSGTRLHVEGGRSQPTAALKVNVALLAAGRLRAEEELIRPKNIFAPLQIQKAPPAKKTSVPLVKAPPVPAPPPVVVPTVPPPPTPEELATQARIMAEQAALMELGQFRYLGYLSRQGREDAFLTKGKDMHIVKIGDAIEQRIVVRLITPTAVTLRESQSGVEKTVPLTP